MTVYIYMCTWQCVHVYGGMHGNVCVAVFVATNVRAVFWPNYDRVYMCAQQDKCVVQWRKCLQLCMMRMCQCVYRCMTECRRKCKALCRKSCTCGIVCMHACMSA